MGAAETVAIARVGVAQIARLRAAATRAATLSWQRLGGLDDQASAAFIADIAPTVTALQETAALATGSYLGAIIGTTPRIDLAAAVTSRGVPVADVYARVAVEARTAIAGGHDWATAMRYAAARARTLAETDIQLAHRAAATQALEQAGSRVVGYRRMPDAGACDLCLIAATQRYHLKQLMPIHNHCGCGVAPIIGSADPGQIIDRQALARLKASGALDQVNLQRRISDTPEIVASYRARAAHWRHEAATTPDQEAETRYAKRADAWAAKADARQARLEQDRAELAAIRERRYTSLTAVHEHGELGPVLTPAGHAFTGPAVAA